MNTLFVSYCHKDKDLLGPLLAQLKALEQAGLLDFWADTRIDAGQKWYPEIEAAMQRAAVAVCLVSEYFLASDFCQKEEIPFLLKRAEQDGLLIIPVLLSDCPWFAHRWIEERQMLPGEGQSIRTHFPNNPAAVFSKVAKRIHDKLKDPAYRPPARRLVWSVLPASRVNLDHLPQTGAVLFGRDEELTLLDQTWASPGSADAATATRVLAFKAQGGVGKSALINRWLDEMKRDHFRGATRVFCWSFYSQGVREQGAASADTFLAAALRFFGDAAMAGSAASAWDKGARLAHLVGAERSLLVLDGMEPLQSAHWVDRGKLRDPGLESLLRGLSRQSAGLCLITTREPLAELGKKAGIVERDLDQITPQAGRALLRAARINGTDAELEGLAQRFGPQALAISLLAVYLHEQPGHGIGPAQQLEALPGVEPVDRVLAGFERMLAGSAELESLRLLGFFDRPADEGCLRALRKKPRIRGLTNRLPRLPDADWPRLLARLETLRLVHVRQAESGKQFVDTHPLIREHFGKQLREQQPDAWRAAHRQLYEHLCATTTDKKPNPTLEDLQPLYQAVAHGCQAGLQQEACDKVYFQRILRRNENYSVRKLGAFGSELGAVACFFETPWNWVSRTLTEADQAWLLNQAAFTLRALGRLTEALGPMRAGEEMLIKQENWRLAAISASNLSELDLTLGEVAGAVGDAEQSVTYADRSGDAYLRRSMRHTHADALHQAGRRPEAQMRFREAEQMQKDDQPDYPLLYSLQGFQYCDLLLTNAERAAWRLILRAEVGSQKSELVEECRAVSQRAATALDIVLNGSRNLLDIALNHLTLGRAALYEAILTNGSQATSHESLDAAVSGLRRAGQQQYLPPGLLTRAWLWYLTGKRTGPSTSSGQGPESAQADLDEAWEITERGPMRLHMADIFLHRARLFRDKTALSEAAKIIDKCGYHRRDEELADTQQAARNW